MTAAYQKETIWFDGNLWTSGKGKEDYQNQISASKEDGSSKFGHFVITK